MYVHNKQAQPNYKRKQRHTKIVIVLFLNQHKYMEFSVSYAGCWPLDFENRNNACCLKEGGQNFVHVEYITLRFPQLYELYTDI